MVRAPRLSRFQSPTDILNGRSKSLPTQNWSYKLVGAGGSQYGLDTLFPETMRIDEANMALWIPVADGMRRDGVGDLLEVGGIDVERHRKNPICLFDHGKKVDLPIGLFETRENGRYTFEIDPVTKSAGGWAYFYQGKGLDGIAKGKEYDHALFCEQTFDMACKRLIRGGSIGYQVKAARELQPDFERATPKGLHLLSILMLEGSLVVLPANMDTVGKLLSDGICCGKSLSPYLVKSLEPYAPERKAMVAVPLANLSETKIPPAEWRPGLGAVKSVTGEEEKAAPLPLTGQAGKVERIANAVQSRSARPQAPPKPPMPRRIGGGFTRKDIRAKYRTKAAEIPKATTGRGAHGRFEKLDWSGETPPQESERGNYENGEMAGHEPLQPTPTKPVVHGKVQAARESARLAVAHAATKVSHTTRRSAASNLHPEDVAAANKPVVAEAVAKPAARIKVPSPKYRQMVAQSQVAQPAPGTKPPTPGTFRRIKELRAKYGKSVVPRDEARRAILAGRHAGIQQRRAGSENAIPERDTAYRRPDEIGAGRTKIPGKRPVAPNPSGPVGGREVTVPESKLDTKINGPTVNIRLPRHKDQPSSHIDPKKARQILNDGTVNGKPLTGAQRRMFGAAAGRGEKKLAEGKEVKTEKESDSAFGRRLGIGPSLEARHPNRRGPAEETVEMAPGEMAAQLEKPARQEGRTYFHAGRKPITMGPGSVPGRREKVKSLRAKYKSGKRELTHSGANERTGTGHIHETPMAAKPSIKVPKASRGGEDIRVPGPEPSKGRVLPYADAVKKPTSEIPEPKPRKKPVAAPAAKPKTPYVPDAAAMRQREAVVRHEQSRHYPKNPHIQRAIQHADRTSGVRAERREEHRNTRRIGAAHRLEPLPDSSRGMMRKSLSDETAEQRAAIQELNQRVVALARHFA